jgi:transcriptional regulator with XRE-family HTH domain
VLGFSGMAKIEKNRLTQRQLPSRIQPMKQKHLSLTDQLRQAVLNCGQSQYAICKATGIDKTALSRFVNGERGVSMEVMNTLGEYLGLRIVTGKPKGKAKKGR